MSQGCCPGNVRILAVAGSSGGHIFPALSLLEGIRKNNPSLKLRLVLPRRSIRENLAIPDYPVTLVSIPALKLSLDFRSITAILNFFKGALEELAVLLSFRPVLVVGFGSLVSVPLVLFARLAGIRTMIHEQNVIPGSANRLLSIFCDRVALSFADTAGYLKCPDRKLVVTGNPLRAGMEPLDKYQAREYFGLSRDKFTILVSGGSQSSRSVNCVFRQACRVLAAKFPFQVIHLAGKEDCQRLTEEYRFDRIEARVFSFLDAMQYAYSAADLAVSRAGATTIAELSAFCLPAILVPYPYARRHQFANARALEEKGAAVVVEEEQCRVGKLAGLLEEMLAYPEKLESMRSNYQKFDLGRQESLYRAALELAGVDG